VCVLLCLVPPDSAALSEIVEDTEATLYLSKGRESVSAREDITDYTDFYDMVDMLLNMLYYIRRYITTLSIDSTLL